jgi:hypothetical protein
VVNQVGVHPQLGHNRFSMDGTRIRAWSHNPILARFFRVAVVCKDLQVVLNSRLCGVGESHTILKSM